MLDETLLDDPDALQAADRDGALRVLATAGAQVRAALAEEHALDRVADDGRPRTVLVAGLGGSAVVGEVVAALAGEHSSVPVQRRRGGPLPGWVGSLDLVIAVSMSGRAPEPLRIAGEAARRGARLVSVCRDGSPLADVTRRARGTLLTVPRTGVPGAPPPGSRTGLWSLLAPVLLACDAADVLEVDHAELAGAADRLDDEAEACRPSSESFVNPAKLLAAELDGSVPVVLSDGDAAQGAAARAVSMLHVTARVPAVRGTLPDDAGDVVALFDGAFRPADDDVFADPFVDGPARPTLRLLLLADQAGEHRAPADRAGPVLEVAQHAGVRVSELAADPGRPVEKLAQLVARTDFAATYLALGSGLDPSRSPHLADLREVWAERG
ncbi:SIS domain-containing protein [Aquipuribacter nitratireducens]|uniref:SIS domain-containing protein n=1 Tax=Aquipuribacter nitratireducens TaxID=650104 RepID=A0ABW0GL74_9MICO